MSKTITITVSIDSGQAFCKEASFEIAEGTNVKQAVALWNATNNLTIHLENHKVGVFGLTVSTDTILKEGDRLEVYQPLNIDPKQARRLRAERAQKRNK
jgi:putative ubiquitin-RnfH superfamily antitoxin RatB of RatAB toxin-antitoxin module